MKTQSINRFAPCLVVAVMAMAAVSARGQEVVHTEPMPIESGGTYVGDDMPCGSCGAMVEEDGGVLNGQCPHCGGSMFGGGGIGGGGGLLGLGLFGGGDGAVEGTIQPRSYGQPDLFYNYYTQGLANRANAQMYLCPHPIPPNVGHTFYTYQPFMPHHHMYPHIDKFHRYYDAGRGMNRTRATYWRSACSKTKNFYWNYLRLPR
jgi:hypothetical protein